MFHVQAHSKQLLIFVINQVDRAVNDVDSEMFSHCAHEFLDELWGFQVGGGLVVHTSKDTMNKVGLGTCFPHSF